MLNTEAIFWLHNITPKAIAHFGASEGQESAVYSRACTGPVVYVEALPKVFEKLKANVAKYPNHVALQACVSDEDGKAIRFNVADNGGQSSSMLAFKEHSKEHPDVLFSHAIDLVTVRPDTLLRNAGIEIPDGSFLCLDLQGAEMFALRGLGDLLPRFTWVQSEFNEREMYSGCVLEPELDAWMLERGYVKVGRWPTKHGWGDCLFRQQSKGDSQ